jgi:hypothetical protein
MLPSETAAAAGWTVSGESGLRVKATKAKKAKMTLWPGKRIRALFMTS